MPLPWALSSNPTSAGVSTIPNMLDTEALHRAAGTLPRAIEVKAIEDCTVEGSTQTNINPSARSGETHPRDNDVTTRPTTGNSTNVLARTRLCRRQCVR